MNSENKQEASMDKIVSLAKRRGFVYPGSEIYGGLANSWDYGPLGTALKNNIKKEWWRMFVEERDDMYGLDGAIIMNRRVWQASGHEKTFSDPLVECKKCHARFREDALTAGAQSLRAKPGNPNEHEIASSQAPRNDGQCPNCGNKEFTSAKQFNLMFKTHIGPAEEEGNVAYLRPETAQAIFVDYKQVLDSFSPKLPFGIAQIGKAFRNEITPGNFIFRTREFEQMEIEYFVREQDWEKNFENWREEMHGWMRRIGLDMGKVHELEVPDAERAHYSKRTIDFEYEFPFGKKELYGLAYRGDFDLRSHEEASGENLKYFDDETKEKFLPHVIEPSLGVDRTLLALLCSAYREETDEKGETRVFLDLKPNMAPYKVAVFPLLANKPELVQKAQEIRSQAQGKGTAFVPVAFDGGGNIGKRYRKQDEIGTPYCITVDFQTLEDNTLTVRERNSMRQERMPAGEIPAFLRNSL
jgi:glycyl-tRNA synthetase